MSSDYNYVNGADFGVFKGDDLILAATDNQMDWQNDMIEVTNKDTGAKEYIPGKEDGTVGGTARAIRGTDENFKEIQEARKNKTKLTIKYSDGTPGEPFYECKAYVQQVSRTDPDNDSATFTYNFQQTGGLTIGTVPTPP